MRLSYLIPSVNTITEGELHRFAPPDVRVNIDRIPVTATDTSTDDGTVALLEEVLTGLERSVRRAAAPGPDQVVLGMSAPVFRGGLEAGRARLEALSERTGIQVTAAALGQVEAVRAFGCRRIGVLSPYQPVNDREVQRFFTEAGLEVVAIESTLSPTARSIARTAPEEIHALAARLAQSEPEIIVQVGANLGIAGLVASLESWFRVPVLSLNLTGLWMAVRASGSDVRLAGLGRLWQDH